MSRPLSELPEYFDEEQKSTWDEVISNAPAGMLQPADRFIVEITVVALVRCRGRNARSVHFRLAESLLARCGLTPRSRRRILKALAPSTKLQ